MNSGPAQMAVMVDRAYSELIVFAPFQFHPSQAGKGTLFSLSGELSNLQLIPTIRKLSHSVAGR